jgi:hypothetical protein
METLPPAAVRERSIRAAIVRRTSRHRYARSADQVEKEIRSVLACTT